MANKEKLKELFLVREKAKKHKRNQYYKLRRGDITAEQYKWASVEEHEAEQALKYFLADDGWWDFMVIKTDYIKRFLHNN